MQIINQVPSQDKRPGLSLSRTRSGL